MAYSSGLFVAGADLAAAQQAKYEAIAQRLRLKAGERVIEIGTGWGGLAIHLARHHGVHVTTVTISQEQHRLALELVAQAGLAERIDVRLCDYRDLQGTWDKLVSVEMVEAVGHRFYATYFATVARLLTAEGLALIQAITIQDRLWSQAVRNVDFIQRFIFPGSEIPCVSVLTSAAAKAGGLGLVQLQDFGAHYARTLACWRQAARDQADRIRELGYPESFLRLWEYYMAYCIGGFAERTISVAHMVFARAGWRDDDHARLVGDA